RGRARSSASHRRRCPAGGILDDGARVRGIMVHTHAALTRHLRPLLLLLVLAVAGPLGAPQPPDTGFYQDFRGSPRPLPPLELVGPDAELVSKPEAEGWRITVPADQPKVTTIGLAMKAPVKGDFELTAGYEILQAEMPKGRSPAGFELFIHTDTPTR